MKSFEKWKTQELLNYFGLEKVRRVPALEAWLDTTNIELFSKELECIEQLRLKLEDEIDNWQEDELKSFFIIPLIELVDFRRVKYYKPFTQRNISVVLKTLQQEEMEVNGRVEFLVAKGLQDPEQPYFFVHEYKPEVGAKNDPIGQLLSAMLVAQTLNVDSKSLYGLYIIGRNWFFVILQGKEYSISKAYDATEVAPLLEIFKILKKMKGYIDDWVQYKG